jgi:DNA-binding XRE family transcriptional regulator
MGKKRPGNPWPPRLKAFRKKRGGITQQQAAELVGVTRRSWINWEMGHQIPTRPVQILISLLEKENG